MIVIQDNGIGIEKKNFKKKITSIRIKTDQGNIKITVSFEISSLLDNRRIIEKSLKIKSLENIYNVNDPKNTNWEEINRIKKKIGEQLLKLADQALYEAKSDYCGACGLPIKEQMQTCKNL